MHEFSLAQSIVDLVQASAQDEQITSVHKVTVVVGQWSAVLPEALQTGFQAIVAIAGPPMEGASLEIVPRPATGQCPVHGTFPAAEVGLTCPDCGATATLTSGTEFYVDSYEGD